MSDTIVTVNAALELIHHEAIVQEAYKDSVGVWTWSVGITDSSGHSVYPRYLDNPQPVKRCLEVFLWTLDTKYVPAVRDVFQGHMLSKAQFAAALSFHYNTGGLRRATWAKEWKAGNTGQARNSFMNWRSPPEIVPRREKERDLFFDGAWTHDGKATRYDVKKPGYRPDFRLPHRIDITADLTELLPA